ncbi:MAG TPA: VOC family protein [Blastocatellia bacterium]|nr:VOC family protein [Blastocatellia bacterium]
MTAKVNYIAEGYHSVTPYLVIKGAAQAIEFYKSAFGATELSRLADPSGTIMHAQIEIGDSRIMIADETPDSEKIGTGSPKTLGAATAIIQIYVPDVDVVVDRAVAGGAKVLIPVDDRFYGDRDGRLADPFGHIWIIGTHKEDVTPEEIHRRVEAFMKPQE